jgi:DNA-binding NtrC family response regulator
MTGRVLIIDDDGSLNQMLQMHFEDLGLEATGAHDCAEGLRRFENEPFDIVLLDQQLPDGTGAELLPRLLEARPGTGVIMMTGQHDLELAIDAIKAGAADFVHKPIDAAALEQAVQRVLAARGPTTPPSGDPPPGAPRDLVGRSAAMLQVSKDIALSAESPAPVLISGETGTGKEVVARLIHQHSRRPGPFVAVNCAAIVETLLESELFGHEKGAFTGATARKAGRFERAAGGTLFLDEVAELAPALQAKLLRVLQEGRFERVGGTATLETDARIVAATHRDLFAEARGGRFREDLAYRLAVVRIHVPALRERPEDIPLLAQALVSRAAARVDRPALPLSRAALDKLAAHDWPGNVRELENLLTRALVQARDGLLTPDLLEPEGRRTAPPATPAETAPLRSLDAIEAEHVQRVLDHTGGHKGRACEILGISRPALDRKIRKYDLRVPG